MTKVAMPEPTAYLYVHGEQEGVRLHKCSEMGLYAGTIEHSLITTDQAEAYKDACVREALEAVIQRLEAESAIARGHKAYSAVLALMSQAELIRVQIEIQ